MVSSTNGSTVSGVATVSRYILLALAALFVAGAVGQFFLAGLSVFDTPLHWSDHRNLGHVVGLLTEFMWIAAIVGRVGWKLIVGSVLMFVLIGAQYAFVEIEEPYVQALHPVNGVVLFALSLWIGLRTLDLVRHAGRRERAAIVQHQPAD